MLHDKNVKASDSRSILDKMPIITVANVNVTVNLVIE